MACMDAACAGRAGEGLHFQNVVRGRDGAILSVEVCLRVPRLEARSRVSPNYAEVQDVRIVLRGAQIGPAHDPIVSHSGQPANYVDTDGTTWLIEP